MPEAIFADPNFAFVLLVLGALGLYWEWHAPGMIVPCTVAVQPTSAYMMMLTRSREPIDNMTKVSGEERVRAEANT